MDGACRGTEDATRRSGADVRRRDASPGRLEAELRRRLGDESSPEFERFFDESLPERTFVKNLERVQGDERDAIILSIGYGKNADGNLLYRFGPLNQAGGERRLNVAVTRARRRMTLVSSFSHAEMDPARSSAEGVRLLRVYMRYEDRTGSGPVAAGAPRTAGLAILQDLVHGLVQQPLS